MIFIKLKKEEIDAIIEDYKSMGSFAKVAKKRDLPYHLVRYAIISRSSKKRSKAKHGGYEDISDFMEQSKDDVCFLMNKYLDILNDDEKLSAAPLNQIATALGILVDRFSKNKTLPKENGIIDEILEAVKHIE